MPEMPVISVLDLDMAGHEGRRRGNHFTSARTCGGATRDARNPSPNASVRSLRGTSAGPAMGSRKKTWIPQPSYPHSMRQCDKCEPIKSASQVARTLCCVMETSIIYYSKHLLSAAAV